MLKIIEPQFHEDHEHKINSLLDLLKIYQDFYLPPKAQEKATFLIAEDEVRGVYGGAVIYSRKISSPFAPAVNDTKEEALGKMFSAFQPKVKVYSMANICICAGREDGSSFLDSHDLHQNLYKNFYKAFIDFGIVKDVEHISFTLYVSNTSVVLPYKEWPYLLEARFTEENDGFLHGILSLKGKKFRVRRQRKLSNESEYLSQDAPGLEGRLA